MFIKAKLSSNQILIYVALLAVLLLGLRLRWQFIHSVQLYPDEFVTLLAVQMISQKGWPIMPSGLFFEHGLLFSYLGALVSSFGELRLFVRYASLLCGGLTLILTFYIGRRWFSPAVGLIATAALTIAPTAMQWSGRARMYALLQLLLLLTLLLLYEGVGQNKSGWRWLALATYLGATLAHFLATSLAPPLFMATMLLGWLSFRSAEERANKTVTQSSNHLISQALTLLTKLRKFWLEVIAFGVILIIAFLVKRMGQPKGVEALAGDVGQAVTGLFEVLQIYSDFSYDLFGGWQAIGPFYLTLPALIFTPFALMAMLWSWVAIFKAEQNPLLDLVSFSRPTLFLSFILLTTTLEMILLVSPERRDDKYLFMLLPMLLLLGATGMMIVTHWFISKSKWLRFYFKLQSPIPALFLSLLIILITWPTTQAVLNNSGDDYDTAFAYIKEHWQEGDTILSGTPAAAAIYLGRNDFYSVQRHGGYDYRILTVNEQAVDRWLGSPAIRTEEALHETLANNRVWLILEGWGLQREYYDLSFQQQLLAQTDYETETQGVFILRSKTNPRPIALTPAHTLEANFADLVQLQGYTVESEQALPGQPLRLTLYWQALTAIPQNYTIFIHLRNLKGGNIAQADHRPLGSMYPTSIWPVGETIRESSDLFLPPDLSPGNYELWAGLYLLETGERLPLQNDTSAENAFNLGQLTILSEK